MIPLWASNTIKRQAAEFLAGDSKLKEFPDIMGVATSRSAWPVYADMGGVLFLDPSGQVILLKDDSPEPTVETDVTWRLTALVSAAEQVPKFRQLLPVRPRNVPRCELCDGRGKVSITSAGWIRCGQCSGLGWKCDVLPHF